MPVQRIAIFDFDGTLFASPEKPDWWPHQGFWGRLETLSPPFVPERPGSEWFSGPVVSEAKQAMGDSETYTCLLTGRVPKFEKRIKEILAGAGLRFDDYFFTAGSSTLPFKLATIEKLVGRFPDVKFVEMWDDRQEHIGDFEKKLEALGVEGRVHHVKKVIRDFEIGPDQIPAVKVATRFIG